MNCLQKTIVLFTIFKVCLGDECTTPKGKKGDCISIYNCEELYSILTAQNESQYDYVKKSQCGYDKAPLVCCPNSKVSIKQNLKGDFLMNKQYCGFQHFDDYIASDKGPKRTNIDEFPWMASLLFTKEGVQGVKVVCSGALINERYVLTVAHCTKSPEYNLVGVRLGEHNLHLDKDCNENTPLEECSDPVQEYGIEKITTHPGFSLRAHINDIALIKLNRTVGFSDFIRPICLPIAERKLATPGETMAVSGWGVASYGESQVSVKKKILVELISLQECQNFYNKRINKADIRDTQICTKEKADTVDIACQGDSGGPTMFVNKNQWHVEGLVSFGSGCGMGAPDVHTRVVSYLDWIADVIKKD